MSRFIAQLIILMLLPAMAAVAQNQIVIDGQVYRDPTRPTGAVREGVAPADPRRPGYVVSFIRSGGSQPMAVVNNTVVHVGDVIDGARVVHVNRDSVTLLVDGEERVIRTFGTSVRSQP